MAKIFVSSEETIKDWIEENGLSLEYDSEMTEVNLRSEDLIELPFNFVESFKHIVNLNLSNNYIDEIPMLMDLEHLEILNVSFGILKNLPENIGNLTKLKELYLSNNFITRIPESLGDLVSLKNLDLSKNQISSIPECMGNLSSLENLILDENKIQVFPETFINLKNLTDLSYKKNKFYKPPQVVYELKEKERKLKFISHSHGPFFYY